MVASCAAFNKICPREVKANVMRRRSLAAGAAWLAVAAGAERVFTVPAPPREGANWRVPLMYQEDLSLTDNVRFRIDLLAWGLPRWRPGKPVPVRNGDRFHRTSFAYGPEMHGVLNLGVQSTEANRSAPRTNASPEALGSRP